MHSGNYSMTDAERQLHCKSIEEMVEHVLKFPLTQYEKEMYDKIQKVIIIIHLNISVSQCIKKLLSPFCPASVNLKSLVY